MARLRWRGAPAIGNDAGRPRCAPSLGRGRFAQQLGLRRQRDRVDLVEEQGALLGPLEVAVMHLRSAREGAFLVPEQRRRRCGSSAHRRRRPGCRRGCRALRPPAAVRPCRPAPKAGGCSDRRGRSAGASPSARNRARGPRSRLSAVSWGTPRRLDRSRRIGGRCRPRTGTGWRLCSRARRRTGARSARAASHRESPLP